MRFAVLCSPDSWYLRDLQRAAADRHTIVPILFASLAAHVSVDGTRVIADGHDLQSFDAVLVRTMPPGSLEQVVFRMNALARLAQQGVPVVNSAKAIETAVDKYLTTALLHQAGFLTPETVVCQSAEAAMQAFDSLGSDVVVKPIFGAEGRGITRLTDVNLALRAFRMLEQFNAAIYLQRFVEHEGYDLRLLVLGDQVLGMKRSNPVDWRTNVSRGATTSVITVDASLRESAIVAARSVGAELAGVDLLPGRDGRMYAIEVNAVPGWKALAAVHRLDIAAMALDYLNQRARGHGA